MEMSPKHTASITVHLTETPHRQQDAVAIRERNDPREQAALLCERSLARGTPHAEHGLVPGMAMASPPSPAYVTSKPAAP
jgi:hypothetical protein